LWYTSENEMRKEDRVRVRKTVERSRLILRNSQSCENTPDTNYCHFCCCVGMDFALAMVIYQLECSEQLIINKLMAGKPVSRILYNASALQPARCGDHSSRLRFAPELQQPTRGS
jgi:hypothetical protein